MGSMPQDRLRRRRGFTLIEMLVVMAILATLLAVAAPRYFLSLDRSKEVALRANLRLLRETIDKYEADTGSLPGSLEVLVNRRYLRAVPVDPMTDSATSWVIVGHPDGQTQGVYDIRSGSGAVAIDGTAVASW